MRDINFYLDETKKALGIASDRELSRHLGYDYTSHALRKFLAPFLHQFCAGVDVRTRQEKIWDIEKMRAQESEKKERIKKIRLLRAIYKDGLSYDEWKKAMGRYGYSYSKEYYHARGRAIIWLKNRGLKPRHICAHFDIGYPTYYAAAKTTQ